MMSRITRRPGLFEGDVGSEDGSGGPSANGAIDAEQVSQITDILSDFEAPSKTKDKGGETREDDKEEDHKDSGKKNEEEKVDKGKKEKDKEEKNDKDKKEDEKVKKEDDSSSNEELISLRAENALLKAKLEENTEKKEEKKEKKEDIENAVDTAIEDFFGDGKDWEDMFEKKDTANKVFSKIKTSAVKDVLRGLPKMIGGIVQNAVEIYSRTSKFYEANSDLKSHKKFIGLVVNDLTSKNPDWNLDKLYEEVGPEVRKRLGLKVKALEKEEKKEEEKKEEKRDEIKKPGFARAGGARHPASKTPELSGIQKDIMDLMT